MEAGPGPGMAVLGHELGNVLNGLLGMAELLRESGLDADQDRWIRAIEHSGRHMRRLIDALSGRLPDDPGRSAGPLVDGIRLMEQIVTSHAPSARETDNNLLLIVSPDIPRHWRCDPCRVRQVLDNLIANALRFTHSGDICAEISRADAEAAGSEGLKIRVRDTGPGIAHSEAERLFKAFRKNLHRGGSRSGGMGLGLHICRDIVQSMEGRIVWVRPAGGGAAFDVFLPAALVQDQSPNEALGGELLGPVACILRLENPLLESVANHLSRLGVEWWTDEHPEPRRLRDRLMVEIAGVRTGSNRISGLRLDPATRGHTGAGTKILQSPVLESGLFTLLLEMLLEWRSSDTSCRGMKG